MKRKFLISVLDNFLNENDYDYSEIIKWSYDNSLSPNVIVLSLKEIQILERGESLNIINEENNSIIGFYEDGWIDSEGVKKRVLEKLENYLIKIKSLKERKLVNEIIRLLNISLERRKNIYFLF